MKIELSKNFAPNSDVDADDVRQMKKALNRLGYYMPPKDTGIRAFCVHLELCCFVAHVVFIYASLLAPNSI